MRRRTSTLLAALACAGSSLAIATPSSAATATQLTLPPANAFAVLGHSCGGITEQTFATGFDPSSGFPVGVVAMSTTCSSGGRGAPPSTFRADATAMWDFTGALVTDSATATPPATSATFSAFDANGNEVYNESATAYLALAPSYVPVPRITALSMSQGPSAGHSVLTVTGTGFTGATSVTFGGTPGTNCDVISSTTIDVTTPTMPAGTVDVIVTTPGGASIISPIDSFSFVGAPIVTGLSPSSGPFFSTTATTVTGLNLSAVSAVTVGDTPVGFSIISNTSLSVDVPPNEAPDTASVVVSSPGGTSPNDRASTFTYLGPGITLSPRTGAVGSTLRVTGSLFEPGESVTVTYATRRASPHPSYVTLCRSVASTFGTISCHGRVARVNAGPLGAHVITAVGSGSTTPTSATYRLT